MLAIDCMFAGVRMLHSDAIKFLNDIALINPDILQSATLINLEQSKDKKIKIVIHCKLDSTQRDILTYLVKVKDFRAVEQQEDVWLIY
jgi:hypothetical protein